MLASPIADSFVCADETSILSLNSCLAPLGSLDGLAVTTVEGLGNSCKGFSSVQGESIVRMHCAGLMTVTYCMTPWSSHLVTEHVWLTKSCLQRHLRNTMLRNAGTAHLDLSWLVMPPLPRQDKRVTSPVLRSSCKAWTAISAAALAISQSWTPARWNLMSSWPTVANHLSYCISVHASSRDCFSWFRLKHVICDAHPSRPSSSFRSCTTWEKEAMPTDIGINPWHHVRNDYC